MENNGYILLHRKIMDNPCIYKDSDHIALWIHILLSATHSSMDAIFGDDRIKLQPGQFITGRNCLSKTLKIQESKIERILKLFEKEKQIEQRKNTKGRLIEVTNWCIYQNMNNKGTTSEQQVNNKGTLTKNERMKEYNIKEYKEKSDKNSTDVYPFFLYVFLELGWKPGKSDTIENLQEWMRLTLKDGGIQSASDAIQTLKEFYKFWDTQRDIKGFKKKNWKATLLNSPSLPNNKDKYKK